MSCFNYVCKILKRYGLLISELAKKAGVENNNGEATMTFFSVILFNKSDIKDF